MAGRIDYYFSMVSPWSYLGHDLFEDLARRHGREIDYVPVNLGQIFPETGGLPLPKRHPVRQRYRLMELQRWREKRGLPLKLSPKNWPVPPDAADRTVIAILKAGRKPSAFLSAAFRAVWDGERAIDRREELERLLSETGYEAGPILDYAESADAQAAYDANRERALAADVFGAPSYVVDGEVFWGQDRLELLDDALASGRAPYRPEA